MLGFEVTVKENKLAPWTILASIELMDHLLLYIEMYLASSMT